MLLKSETQYRDDTSREETKPNGMLVVFRGAFII